MTLTLFHNPRCSKSRATLALLSDRNLDLKVVEYLKKPLDRHDLLRLINALDGPPASLVRQGDAGFADSGLTRDCDDPGAIADALAAHPVLMQRPVLLAGKHARIGRPPERVLELL